MRVLGVDFGAKRIGLAMSDASAMLARPWRTIAAGPTPAASAASVAALLAPGPDRAQARNADREDETIGEVGAVVVGLPRRLNGEDTDQSQPARDFAAALGELTGLTVHMQDERLSSREAESRLAVHEKDWRKRKAHLDAASAAVILQDYLDHA